MSDEYLCFLDKATRVSRAEVGLKQLVWSKVDINVEGPHRLLHFY